jgi:NAD(P)-dependent dehydrogenase (short-subunit alcohol dehydrogenase family)
MPYVLPQWLLLGQKALVTGASSGIRRAIALAQMGAGAEVAVNYTSGADKVEALVAEIRATRADAIIGEIRFCGDIPGQESALMRMRRSSPQLRSSCPVRSAAS